jgi:uncharacterized membrane protein YhaH (DUF805 family)
LAFIRGSSFLSWFLQVPPKDGIFLVDVVSLVQGSDDDGSRWVFHEELVQMNSENPYEAPKAGKIFSDDSPLPPREEPTLTRILFSFEGRIPRRVYWGVSLGVTLVFYAAIFGLIVAFGEDSPVTTAGILLLYIPLIWISLAVQVKRWHDRDKSGWWILINIIPLIGPLWAFVETGCLRGTFGPNSYGPDPT